MKHNTFFKVLEFHLTSIIVCKLSLFSHFFEEFYNVFRLIFNHHLVAILWCRRLFCVFYSLHCILYILVSMSSTVTFAVHISHLGISDLVKWYVCVNHVCPIRSRFNVICFFFIWLTIFQYFLWLIPVYCLLCLAKFNCSVLYSLFSGWIAMLIFTNRIVLLAVISTMYYYPAVPKFLYELQPR